MDHAIPLNRAQAHNALRQIASELSPAVKKMAENLLAQLDDSGIASVKSVHETLFPLAKTTSAAAQLSTLVKKIEEAAQKKRLTLKLSFTGTKKEGVAKRQLFFTAPRPTPVADTEGLDAIAPEQRITGQLATPLEDPRILLLTFNDNEFAAVHTAFGYKNNNPPVLGAGAEAVDDLGTINGWRILHGHSRQGNRESQRSADVLCRAHHPHAIIAVGIAYGVDEQKQAIGEVLVSKFIVDYEAGRVNPTSIELRGARPNATRHLVQGLEQLNVHSSGDIAWPKLHINGLLSGEKLVDNRDYRDSLVKLANQGDIIGGEMEAAGLFTALDDTGTGWVVVKAICDFADGNKNEDKEKRQQLAATNAASVVYALLSSPFLKKPDDTSASPPPLEPSDSTHRKRANLRHDHELLGCKDVNVWGQCANAVSLENIRADDERKNVPQVVAFEHLLQWQADETAPPLYALLGEYGMGKTTHCQALTRHLEEQRDAGKAGRAPLYFDLRKVERIAAAQANALGHVATLEETVQDCLRNGYLQTSGQAYTYQDVLDVIDQGALVIFDGLDEVLSRITDAQGLRFTANLLKVLPEARARQAAAGRTPADLRLPKVLLSCRTQFFRNLAEQNSHLTGEHRGSQSAGQYVASVLQPFTDEQIRSYLQAVLPDQDIDELMTMVAAIHNLRELTGRPFTLKLVAQFVPRIQSWQQQGRTITGATLYREVAREWLIRDKEKQSFQPQDKERLAGDLAAHLWRTGQRGMRAFELEQWLDAWLGRLPAHATVLQKPRELLHQDLRNATFLKRTDAEKPEDSRFEFAHTSLQEFFLADYLFRSLQQAAADPGSQDTVHPNWAMPIPSDETLDFLGQILAEAGAPSIELQVLSKWRKPYMPLASELQLAYALRAFQRAWPVPVTAGSDLRGATLSDWHFGTRSEPGVQPKSTSTMQTPLFDLSGCDFTNARLRRSKFWRVRLDNAVFSGAALTQAEMLDCSHTRTAWPEHQTDGLVFRPALPDDADYELAAPSPAQKKALCTQTPDPAALMLHTATGHSNGVTSCTFSPDGKLLLSGADDCTLKLWDVQTGECLRSFSGHSGWVTSCAFSADGKLLLSGSADCTLKLWDVQTGECLRSFSGHSDLVRSCAFSVYGKLLLSGSADCTLKLWDLLTGECLHSFSGHSGWVTSCTFSADGKLLLSGSDDSTIKLWDVQTGECLHSFSGHSGLVKSCSFSPDGKLLLSGATDCTLKLWDVQTGECLRSLDGHSDRVTSCAFSADGKLLLSGSDDRSLKLWDAQTGQCLRSFLGHISWVTSCTFSAGGKLLLSGAYDCTLKLWDAQTGECLRRFSGRSSWVTSCAFSPDGKLLLSGSTDCNLKLWDAQTGKCLRSFSGHSGGVTACAFSLDGKLLLSGAYDRTLKLWDALTGECLRSFLGHSGWVTSCAFSTDGKFLLSGAYDRTLKLWDALTGECLRSFLGHSGLVTSCAFSADGKLLLSGSKDFTLKLWDAQTGECLRSFLGHNSGVVTSCAFSEDGKLLLSGSVHSSSLKLWDTQTGKCLCSFSGHSGWVTSCSFSADGKFLLSGSTDCSLKLWDAQTGECLRSFLGHSGWVKSCAFSADGKFLFSGSDDSTLKLWDALTGECLRTFLDIPQGAAAWEGTPGKLLYASGRAWRYLRWQGYDQDGNTCVYPLESVPGVAVLPWTLD